jgi:hypothetical protein
MKTLDINIKDIGKKVIEVDNIEGSENHLKNSKLNLNTEKSQEKAFNIPLISTPELPTPISIAYLPLSAELGAIFKVDVSKLVVQSTDHLKLYQYCITCDEETNHSIIECVDRTIVSCRRCNSGYVVNHKK